MSDPTFTSSPRTIPRSFLKLTSPLPEATVKSAPVIRVVSPLRDIAPVPVEKVPEPEIAKLPDVWVYPVMFCNAPA